MTDPSQDPGAFDPAAVKRPDESLLTYYIIVSALALVAAPFVFVPLLIRYKTMRYQLDDQGISMRWGFFFRREVYLTYRRLQDIHVTRNLLERWMGLAKVPIQTASGTSGATMRIEGIRDPEPLRDYLYARMRGARAKEEKPSQVKPPDDEDALAILREIRDELRRVRETRGIDA